MIQNHFTIHIRRAESGDEACLAHVQTESWKAAFAGIVPAELLTPVSYTHLRAHET